MLRGDTLGAFSFLLSILPVTMANYGPYNLTVNPRKPSAREDEFLLIRASADCNPACSFTWSMGDDVVNQGTLLRFDKFQSRDANNYTVRAQNAYGTADLGVEVILDAITGPAANSCNTENIIIGVLAAVACVSITSNIVFFTVALRRGLWVCKKGDRKPASTTAVYVNSGLIREPGNPVADYVNSRTDLVYEEINPTIRGPAHPPNMAREVGLDSAPVTSGGHHPPGIGGLYEPVDPRTSQPTHPPNMAREDGLDSAPVGSGGHHPPGAGGAYKPVDQRTREPVRPTNKVYAALRNASVSTIFTPIR